MNLVSLDKILNEVEKMRGKKKDTLKQHPHIVESRRHWDWEQSYYDIYGSSKSKDKGNEVEVDVE